MDHGTDSKVFDVMKVEFRFRLLFRFVPSIDVVHLHATKPSKMSIPLRLEAKRAKMSDPTSAPRFFAGDFSVCFGCQMSFPPFTVEEWIRIVDSFQIFLLGICASLRIDFSWCQPASPNGCMITGNASSGR